MMNGLLRLIITGVLLGLLITLLAFSTGVSNPQERDFQELRIETLVEGQGDRVIENGDVVSVHYRGTLRDGSQFDSSYDRGEPFSPLTVGAGQVIQGWEEGLIGMKLGETRLLEIPSTLGYGSVNRPSIPSNSGLIFEVELVEFIDN